MTNDVEEVSIVNNNLSYKTGKKVAEEGLPLLLDIYSKYDVEGTFYFTGTFAEKFPEAVQSVVNHGHEVGCHGYSHDPHYAFDNLSSKDQYIHLLKAKKSIEKIAGTIEAFRAPALRLGFNTIPILEKLGFRSDSSIASQRFEGPLTFGSLQKLRWLVSPRMPYMADRRNPFKKGKSNITEVPVSALILGYQGTTMRVAPEINKLIGNFLYRESKKNGKPIVFLFHPNELITEEVTNYFKRRSKSYIGYIFGDVIRRKLKLKNLGKPSITLLENVLKKSINEGFEFISVKSYRRKCGVKLN